MNHPCIFPTHGNVVTGLVPAQPGLFDDSVSFEFRPMSVQEATETDMRRQSGKPDQFTRYMATELVEHLQSWDVKCENGEAVEITVENVLRLHPYLFRVLFGIVAGDYDAVPREEQEPEASGEAEDKAPADASGGETATATKDSDPTSGLEKASVPSTP